jgi:hypothetical protein
MVLVKVEYIESGQEVREKVDIVGEKGYRPLPKTQSALFKKRMEHNGKGCL